MFSMRPTFAGGIFSITTMLPGWFTAKYGSAVTIMPKVCISVIAFTWLLLWSTTSSPRFTARPSGEMAHRTSERYSRPNLVGSSRPKKLGVDFNAACFACYLGFSGGILHQFGAVKVDLDGVTAQTVVHRLGGAMHRRSLRRSRGLRCQ